MGRILVLTAVLAGLSLAAGASAAQTPTLVISHQVKGCHSWSLNGAAGKVVQTVHITKGGSVVVTNNDAMYHKLIKVSGPAVAFKLLKTGTAIKKGVKLPWAAGM